MYEALSYLQVQLLMGRYRELAERKKAGALRYSVLLALLVQKYKYGRIRRNRRNS